MLKVLIQIEDLQFTPTIQSLYPKLLLHMAQKQQHIFIKFLYTLGTTAPDMICDCLQNWSKQQQYTFLCAMVQHHKITICEKLQQYINQKQWGAGTKIGRIGIVYHESGDILVTIRQIEPDYTKIVESGILQQKLGTMAQWGFKSIMGVAPQWTEQKICTLAKQSDIQRKLIHDVTHQLQAHGIFVTIQKILLLQEEQNEPISHAQPPQTILPSSYEDLFLELLANYIKQKFEPIS